MKTELEMQRPLFSERRNNGMPENQTDRNRDETQGKVPEADGPVVQVRGIAHHFRKKQVLTDITFDVQKGECAGIVGLNGCGKSTLLSALAGMRKPSGGTFYCMGRDMFREKGWFSRLIAYVPQENPLIGELSVRDNIRLWTGGGEADAELFARMKFFDLMDEPVAKLSGGTKRRLVIACAMCSRKPVLIMDEPTSSLDLHQRSMIHGCIRDYLGAGGTIVMATHDAEEIRACSALYYIEDGTAKRMDADQVIARLREGS